MPLVVVESPYRALTGPLEAYLDVLDAAWPPDKPTPITFVVLPEYVARRWWERILYNQSVKRLRSALLGRPHTVVVNVPVPARGPGPLRADAAASGPAERPGLGPTVDSGGPDRPSERRPPGAGSARPRAPAAASPCVGAPPTAAARREVVIVPAVPRPNRVPPFRRAVVALSGHPNGTRLVRLVAEIGQAAQSRADRRPRRRGRLVDAARHRRRGSLRGDPAGARPCRGDRRVGRREARAGPAPGPRRRRGARRRGASSARPTCSSSASPIGRSSAAISPSAGRSPTC